MTRAEAHLLQRYTMQAPPSMQDLRLPPPRAHEIYLKVRARDEEDDVWWTKKGPAPSAQDEEGYPTAYFFGQVVSEVRDKYIDVPVKLISTKTWKAKHREVELAAPVFQKEERVAAMITKIFNTQARNLDAVQSAEVSAITQSSHSD